MSIVLMLLSIILIDGSQKHLVNSEVTEGPQPINEQSACRQERSPANQLIDITMETFDSRLDYILAKA